MRTYSNMSELDSFASPSRAYSTEDGLFSTSPWIIDDENPRDEFIRIQDLRVALEARLHEASSSSGSARRSEMPKSVESQSSDSIDSNARNDADDDDGRDETMSMDQDHDQESPDMDAGDNVWAEGIDIDLPLRPSSFQMRVFDPGSTDYESSKEYSAATIATTAQEWSGKVQELPSIREEGSIPIEAKDFAPAYVKRRSSDTFIQSAVSPNIHGMRRVSTMTDYQRLKGRHKSPKLVAFKASPASPAMTAMSVQPAEAWKVATIYEDPGHTSYGSEHSSRRTSQTIRSDLGISQMVWEEPSSSSDSDITVLTGSGVDYLVAQDVEGDNASSSPMERLKTKLKAWSWERELSEASHDSRLRQVPRSYTEERSGRRQSSDYLEEPPGPPNTVRHSGQSSALNSDPQTPTDADRDEYDEDDSVIELKAKAWSRPIPVPSSTSSAVASSSEFLAIPRRTSSLPVSPSVSESEETRFPHRDSVDISHARMDLDEIRDKRNQELIMNARDSFLITKSRLEARHPKIGRSVTPPGGAITWSRFGGLSPIVDASPPGVFLLEARAGKQKLVQTPEERPDEHEAKKAKQYVRSAAKKKVEVVEISREHENEHENEHEDCPICEVHRPRWFETEHREW